MPYPDDSCSDSDGLHLLDDGRCQTIGADSLTAQARRDAARNAARMRQQQRYIHTINTLSDPPPPYRASEDGVAGRTTHGVGVARVTGSASARQQERATIDSTRDRPSNAREQETDVPATDEAESAATASSHPSGSPDHRSSAATLAESFVSGCRSAIRFMYDHRDSILTASSFVLATGVLYDWITSKTSEIAPIQKRAVVTLEDLGDWITASGGGKEGTVPVVYIISHT